MKLWKILLLPTILGGIALILKDFIVVQPFRGEPEAFLKAQPGKHHHIQLLKGVVKIHAHFPFHSLFEGKKAPLVAAMEKKGK